MPVFNPNFYSDIRIEEINSTRIHYIDGELENVVTRKRNGVFFRVFDGNKWYYGVTTELDNLQAELDKLYAIATPNPQIAEHPITKKMPSHTAVQQIFSHDNVCDVPVENKVKLVESVFPVLNEHARISMWQAYYTDKHVNKRIINSKGADITIDWQQCGAAYYVVMREGTKTFNEKYEETASRFADLSISQEKLNCMLTTCEDYLLNSRPLPAGKYQTILSPIVAGVFAHESFGHKSEADFMIGDENMKKEWQIGKRVGSDILSIIDDGSIAGSGYIGYDDEGIKAGRTYLIKNGLLAGRLHNTETAVSLNEEQTGNARAISFEYEPIVRMTSTIIEPGTISKEELFAKVKQGIYIDRIKHGSGMSTFTLAPSLAYYIENGKIVYPVEISVITGSVFETLNKIEALSDQQEIFSFSVGGCGKMEQYPLPVSFGGPYVLVSELSAR